MTSTSQLLPRWYPLFHAEQITAGKVQPEQALPLTRRYPGKRSEALLQLTHRHVDTVGQLRYVEILLGTGHDQVENPLAQVAFVRQVFLTRAVRRLARTIEDIQAIIDQLLRQPLSRN